MRGLDLPEGLLPVFLTREQAAFLGEGGSGEYQGQLYVTCKGLEKARTSEPFIDSMVQGQLSKPEGSRMTRHEIIQGLRTGWELLCNVGGGR